MKINLDYDGYDIRCIDDIEDAANDILRKLNNLSEFGDWMRRILVAVRPDFDTINYDRANESVGFYMKHLVEFQMEMEELSKSAKEFHDEIKRRWS